MLVHHLNCGTLCPYGGRLISGEDGLGAARLVCHCLLIEAGESLVLIDTGFGTEDAEHPYRRLGIPLMIGLQPKPKLGETALEQVRGLGFDPDDVRRIAVTHLDLDHSGGLPDFRDAEVHVFRPERDAALKPSLRERPRYSPSHFDHGPNWVTHENGGDRWFGFESIRVMEGVGAEIALIPLPGHTRGHSAIAIRDGEGWILHCGDAYFHRNEIAADPSCPPALRLFQLATCVDNGARTNNRDRLQELAQSHGDEIRLFCAHDAVELDEAAAPRA